MNAAEVPRLAEKLRTEAHVLLDDPRSLSSHLHNSLCLDAGEPTADPLIDRALAGLEGRAWLRLVNRPLMPRGRSRLVQVHEHDRAVRVVRWSPNGRLIASGGTAGAVRIWEPTTGIVTTELSEHDGPVTGLGWSPDGEYLVTGDEGGTVRLWAAVGGAPRLTLPSGAGVVEGLAWSPTGSVLAAGYSGGAVRLWEPETFTELASPELGSRPCTELTFSPDGRLLATADEDGTVRLWSPDAETEHVVVEDQGSGTTLAWTPTGRLVSTESTISALSELANLIHLTDVRTSERTELMGFAYRVNALACSPDGSLLASGGSKNQVNLQSLGHRPDATSLPVLRGHTGAVRALDFSPDGRLLASGGDTTVRLWDVQPGDDDEAEDRVPLGHFGHAVEAVAISPDGTTVASGGDDEDDCLMLWDTVQGAKVGQYWPSSDGVYGLAYAPDGKTLASAGLFRIALWDVGADQEPEGPTLTESMHTALGDRWHDMTVAWSPDGVTLSSAGLDGPIRLWRRGQRSPTSILEGHGDSVFALAWSADGSLLASGSRDGTVAIWDPRTGRRLSTLDDHAGSVRALAWSPAGDVLGTAGADATLRLWDVADPSDPRARVVLRDHLWSVQALAWAADGSFIVSADAGGAVLLRSLDRLDARLAAYCPSGIMAVRIDPGGRIIQVVDDGAATGRRPTPYRFELVPGRGLPRVDRAGRRPT